MLIDAKLEDLRGVLGNSKDSMVTKGVESVSSPVRNLRYWSTAIDHDSFVDAVVAEFKASYGGSPPVTRVDERELQTNAYVRDISLELKSWEYMYGQSPEFSYELSKDFPSGPVSVAITSRHALITSAKITSLPRGDDDWQDAVKELVALLPEDRYGSLEKTTTQVGEMGGKRREYCSEVLDWLKEAM